MKLYSSTVFLVAFATPAVVAFSPAAVGSSFVGGIKGFGLTSKGETNINACRMMSCGVLDVFKKERAKTQKGDFKPL